MYRKLKQRKIQAKISRMDFWIISIADGSVVTE